MLPLRLEHRSLGYECQYPRNLKTMRGAKSNALFATGANCIRPAPVLPSLSP
jgi:hypothetical protein